ncbi:hypothetical protein F5Y04DRAFT_290115 [Hypomontagnella monticulosa]|nr:hypothetical protein F5Y04DRAFT_290115 [Hypomontagnella monticulosa]
MLLNQVTLGFFLLPLAASRNIGHRHPTHTAARSFLRDAVLDNSLIWKRGDGSNTCDLNIRPPAPPAAPIPDDSPTCLVASDCTTSGYFLIPTSVPTLLPSTTIHEKRTVSPIDPPGTTPVLHARTPGVSEPQPLLSPRNARGHERFIDKLRREADRAMREESVMGGWINIYPSQEQLWYWKVAATIDGQYSEFPVGLTSQWNEFGEKRATWRVFGLQGCTMIFIVSSRGFWASHIWENTQSDDINGGSAFLRRTGPSSTTPRSREEFAVSAIQPMTQALPLELKYIVEYLSLADLRTDYDDPLGDPSDVQVYIWTRAASRSDSRPKYADRIRELKAGVAAAIPGFRASNVKVGTYIGAGDHPTASEATRGTMHFQYSPYHAKKRGDECTPLAAFRMWEEDKPEAKMERIWEALPWQRSSNMRKRDACAATTTKPNTEMSTSTLSCSYLSQDPGRGRTAAACVCNSTKTLPLLKPTTSGTKTFANSESCKYTTIPDTATSSIAVATKTDTQTSKPGKPTPTSAIVSSKTRATMSSRTSTASPSRTKAA